MFRVIVIGTMEQYVQMGVLCLPSVGTQAKRPTHDEQQRYNRRPCSIVSSPPRDKSAIYLPFGDWDFDFV